MKSDEIVVTLGGIQYSVHLLSENRVLVNGIEHHVQVYQHASGPTVLHLDGVVFRVSAEVGGAEGKDSTIAVNGRHVPVTVEDRRSRLLKSMRKTSEEEGGVVSLRAPMPGMVVRVEVKAGQLVQKGDGLLILEAMKMENELKADKDGRIVKVAATEKMPVEKGQILLTLDTSIVL